MNAWKIYRRWMGYGIGILGIAGMCMSEPVYAQDAGNVAPSTQESPAANSGEELALSGDKTEFDLTQKIATYTGNAKVVQGDTSIACDMLKIYLGSTAPFEKAEAIGNVQVITPTMTAVGDDGVYYGAEQRIELHNHVKVTQENNTLTVARLVVFRQEQIMEGYSSADGAERVVMTVSSRGNVSLFPSSKQASNHTPTEDTPAVITSDAMRLEMATNHGTFTGHVLVTKDASQIRADEMQIFTVNNQENKQEIERVELAGNVEITRDTAVMSGDKGTYTLADQRMVIEGGESKAAQIEDKTQNLLLSDARIITILLADNNIEAEGTPRVKTILTPKKEQQNAAPDQTPVPGTDVVSLGKSDVPIVLTGDKFVFNSDQKIATYTGNVKVVQGETNLFSDTLQLSFDAEGKQFEKAIATGNVRVVNADITATGDEGIFYNTEQKLELTNNAKIWQDDNTITAHRLVSFLQKQIVEGYSNEATSERAVMTMYVNQADAKLLSADNSAKPPKGNDSKSQDDAAPIVISADTLRLDKEGKLAMYKGNVVATRGATEIRADEMRVFIMTNKDGKNDVEKVEAIGNISITKDTLLVTGETGTYTLADQLVVIEGSDIKKAHAEDKARKITLSEAQTIKVHLATNKIEATGTQGGKVKTIVNSVPGQKQAAPAPKTTPEAKGTPAPSATPKAKGTPKVKATPTPKPTPTPKKP